MKRTAESVDLSNDSNPPMKKRKVASDSNDNNESNNAEPIGELWTTGWVDHKDYRSSLIWAIRRKINWKQKINNEKILKKWQKEAAKQDVPEVQFYSTVDMLKEMIKKDESMAKREKNEYYSSDSDESINLEHYGVALKDEKELCMKSLGNALRHYINENIEAKLSDNDKDWHPDTHRTVLDLVHPSLYCYVKDESVVAESTMDDTIRKYIKDKEKKTPPLRRFFGGKKKNKPASDEKRKYQWLPAEFKIRRDKKNGNKVLSVDILSYINNLDRSIHGELYDIIGNIFGKMVPLFDSAFGKFGGTIPETCQVIVKLANIVLDGGDKGKSEYDGGSWHIEGMEYEHIIASGIYYYDIHNIRDSYLQFRVERSGEFGYEQGDTAGVWESHGLEDGDALNRYLGKIAIDKEQCVCFPNTMQHRVTKFRLRDKSKHGKRKILVFFLIDPKKSVMSTKHVPFQQLDVMRNYLRSILKNKESYFEGLEQMIGQYMPCFNLKKAKQNREKLMSVRKYIISEQNDQIYERPFSLCEH